MSQKNEGEDNNEIKVIFLGSVGVGKTSLIARYKTHKFIENITSTFGPNFMTINKIIKNKKYVLNLWDTAGQEKYHSLTQTFTKNAKVIVLVYSITDKKSFSDLDSWLKSVKDENGEQGYTLGIAANKSDLYDQSQVDDEEGKNYSKKINAIWKSTSALEEDQGIEELMNELLNNYVTILEKDLNINDVTIKLDSSIMNDKKKGNCCKGNVNEKKIKVRHKSHSVNQSSINKYVNANENKDK